MKLNDDKTRIRLEIDKELDAAALDQLLRDLAELRAEMLPAVVQNRNDLDAATASVLVEDKPGLVMARLAGGGFRLWLRHRGFGWLAYQIDAVSASGIKDYLNARLAGIPETDFVSNQGPNLH